jgi:hypothetical protein
MEIIHFNILYTVDIFTLTLIPVHFMLQLSDFFYWDFRVEEEQKLFALWFINKNQDEMFWKCSISLFRTTGTSNKYKL